jgi:hypothetical protein
MAEKPTLANCPPTGPCDARPAPVFAHDGATGPYKPPELCVGQLDYSTSECANNEADLVANYQAEALNAAAGPVNVFPMLGVHSQGSTMDLVNANGYAVSGGTPAGFNIMDAFNVGPGAWRSVQQGEDVLTAPAWIGWSFGTKKAWEKIGPPQERYQQPAPVLKQIGAIKIQQGDDATNRATQARVEASDDGITWRRVAIIALPNSNELVTIPVNANAKHNMWRIVPTFFGGVTSNAQWEVTQLQLVEATVTQLDNIEDFFLLENRDRSYCRQSIMLKCQYDLLDVQTELAKFGISLPETYIFTTSFAMMVQTLGRPVVVGDILELPGEVQYDPNLRPVRKWLEVTDTNWSTEGYTYNWKPQLFRFYAQPIFPSVEHRDILGLPGKVNETQTDDDVLLNGFLQNDQAYKAEEAIRKDAEDNVPQTGSDPQDIRSAKSLSQPPGTYDGRDLYVEDAIPPDGAPFSYGDTLPAANTILDGHYHRQTYTMIDPAIRPPDRLLKWNGTTQRWAVIEVNSRATYQSHKQTIGKFIASSGSVPPDSKL